MRRFVSAVHAGESATLTKVRGVEIAGVGPSGVELVGGGSERHRSADLSIFSRTLYQLSYRALPEGSKAQPLARVAVPCDPDRT